MKLKGNKILITGGATGIGLGLTERFLKEGNTLIVCGRREDVLNNLKTKYPEVITKVCDVSIAAQREDLYQWISSEHSETNVLINNAGIQNWMHVTDDNFFQKTQQEIHINVEAPVHLSSMFIRSKSVTTIMNVTSGLSFVPMIKTPVYCGTKAFLHSFTLSLRELIRSKNIEVIEIIPPALNTDLGGKGLHDFAPPVSDFIESIFKQLEEGKTELTFGMSEMVSKASAEDIKQAFVRINQLV